VRKAQKEQVVAELEEVLKQPGSVILVDYRALKVREMGELRRALAKAGGQVRVVKNTLLRRALEGHERAGLTQFLEGPVAMTLAPGDPVAVLKEMATFARTHQQFELKGGWSEGRVFSGADLTEMATLPPREALLGRLVGVLSAPLSQLVGTLQAMPRDLVLTLQALAKQREQQAGAPASA